MDNTAVLADDTWQKGDSRIALDVHEARHLPFMKDTHGCCVPGIALEHRHSFLARKLFPERPDTLQVVRIFNNCGTEHRSSRIAWMLGEYLFRSIRRGKGFECELLGYDWTDTTCSGASAPLLR